MPSDKMKITLIVWADPRAYLGIISTAQTLSKRGLMLK